MEQKLSRKEFLKKAGVTVAGVAVTGSIATVLSACSAQPAASLDENQAPAYPFAWKKIDPVKVEEAAFKGYKEKGG